MKRWLARAASFLVFVGLIGVGVAFLWWRFTGQPPGPPANGSFETSGVNSPVKISRDPFGVPHVRAKSNTEAYFGLGFVHAQDRLWQMEILRRAARGKLSELFGENTLGEDQLSRTLGFGLDAEAEISRLPKRTLAVLAAYSSGVNLWIEKIESGEVDRPYEFAWLEHSPEPWSPEDTLAILRMRAWNTGRSLGASLLLDRLVREIGGVPARDFFPVRPEDGAHDPLGEMFEVGKAADNLAQAVGMNGPIGSLGFAISGERSATGGAMLANDPHVQFGLPATFYLAHVSAAGNEISGATWPGIPVFWAGTNGKIAWGQVALHASVSDLFDETFHPTDPLRYDRNGRWRKVERRVETLGVRGQEDRQIEVVSTHHGPILRSMQPDESRAHTLALSWTGHNERSGIESLLRVHGSDDWESFRKALRRLPAPASTFLYADVEGNIGSQVAGHLPVRAIETGLLPVTGGSRYYDWRGFMDYEKLPSKFGKELPWVVASTHPDAKEFAAPVVWLWSNPAGAKRIEHLLASSRRIDLPRALEIQRDRSSHRGRSTVAHLLNKVEPDGRHARRVRTILLDWDGHTEADSVGASVYHVFRHRLTRRLLETQLEGASARYEQITDNAGPLPGIVLARFLDRARDRQVAGLIETALDDTWRYMRTHVSSNPRKWEWGRVHQLRLEHDFEKLGGGLVGWIGKRLARGPFAAQGAPDAVWTMHHRRLPTAQVEVGPALRYAVDMSDPGHAQVGLAGGQSGHPGDPHYDDALQDWLRGRARPLWMHWSDVAYHSTGDWEIRPTSD